MPALHNPDEDIIAEFRANEGRVAGPLDGVPMILVHHVGRTSGKEYVTPLAYTPSEGDHDMMYIIASKAGAPVHPGWYWNLPATGKATVELGKSVFQVAVAELTGAERDRVYAEAARRVPAFIDHARKAEGRTIPVLRLTRTAGTTQPS
jgi:deazaflavin-dependent oxidoreductase (nitroreductase family)